MREKAGGKCTKRYSSYCVTGFFQIFAWVGSVFRNLDSTIDTIEASVDDKEKLKHNIALYEEDLADYPSTSLQNQNMPTTTTLISTVSSCLLDDTTRHLEQQYDEQNMWAVLEKMENVVMYFARVGDCIVLK